MSVLSRPQGTPERVWSIIGGLGALGGETGRDDLVGLLNPGFVRAGEMMKAAPTLAGDTPGVAGALGLFERESATVKLTPGDPLGEASDMADRVHDTLCAAGTDDLNRVILEAYAWLVAETARRRDLGWLFDIGNKEFADQIDAGLVGEDEDGRLMNATKVTPWRRWLRFLGLGAPMPEGKVDFPTPAGRTAIELQRAGLEVGKTLTADAFIKLVAARCPYLDRGRLFAQACDRIGFTPSPRALSPVLSCGIRDLEADGVISINIAGDAADSLSLAGDPVAFDQSFNSITYLGPVAAA